MLGTSFFDFLRTKTWHIHKTSTRNGTGTDSVPEMEKYILPISSLIPKETKLLVKVGENLGKSKVVLLEQV